MCSAWSCSTAEKERSSRHFAQGRQTLPFSIWSRVRRLTAGVGSSSMSRMWTRSGDASTNWASSLKRRGMLLGARGISTCSILMDFERYLMPFMALQGFWVAHGPALVVLVDKRFSVGADLTG